MVHLCPQEVTRFSMSIAHGEQLLLKELLKKSRLLHPHQHPRHLPAGSQAESSIRVNEGEPTIKLEAHRKVGHLFS